MENTVFKRRRSWVDNTHLTKIGTGFNWLRIRCKWMALVNKVMKLESDFFVQLSGRQLLKKNPVLLSY